jgi:hypothetical protein
VIGPLPRVAPLQNAITGKYRKGKPPLVNSKNVRTPTNKFEAKWDEGMPKPKTKADVKAAPGADAKAAPGADAKAAPGAAAKVSPSKAGAKSAVEDDDEDGAKEEPKLWVGNFRCTGVDWGGGGGGQMRKRQGHRSCRARVRTFCAGRDSCLRLIGPKGRTL